MIHADQSIDEKYISSGKWEVNIASTLYPVEVSLKPMYGPGMERIKI